MGTEPESEELSEDTNARMSHPEDADLLTRKRIPQNQLRKRTHQFNHTSELDMEPELSELSEPDVSEPDAESEPDALEPDAEDMFQLSTTTTAEATADQPKSSTTQPTPTTP